MQNHYTSYLSRESLASHSPNRRTKIVATIGPASDTEEKIAELIQAGMNVARFNTKHNLPDWHLTRIQRLRKVAAELGVKIPILLDLQGPEIRLKILHGDSIVVEENQELIITSQSDHQNSTAIYVPQDLITALEVGREVLFADGSCEFVVIKKEATEVVLKALGSFTVKNSKTVNTPGVVLNMPSLLLRDISFIEILKYQHIEFIGLSFIRSKADIDVLRGELQQRKMDSAVIAKIENQAALDHIDEIIGAADAVMIARGDLGVEVPYYEVPHWQKVLIPLCHAAQKPVITATQMLLSMTEKPRPTRAEVSDVANAIYDGTDAVMLSEETASGKYPVRAVQVQAKIAEYHEKFLS